MAPPAKRQRRNVLPSSSPTSSEHENEKPVTKSRAKSKDRLVHLISSSPSAPNDDKTTTSVKSSGSSAAKREPLLKATSHPLNAAPSSTLKPARGGRTTNKSASSSPEKSKRKGKVEEKVKSGDLFTFFTKQAQRQQAEGASNGNNTPPMATSPSSKESKPVDDDLISDDDVVESKAPPASMVGQAARKRARGTDTLKNGKESVSNATQKFVMKPAAPQRSKADDDMRPWAERFAPVDLIELAVHKKKVADVRTWLENVMTGKMRQRLLVLKGAAGTGKTTTVQLLAKDMDCDVLEWRNPVGSVATSDGNLSTSAQFEDFMGRGGKFGQLDIFSEVEAVPPKPKVKPLDRRKQIILIEEFPNTFTRSSTALQSFRSTIIQYLASNTPPLALAYNNNIENDPITPVVMIVSETLLTTTSASADSFTAHRLLGPEILLHPGAGVIEFNAIAPTLLAKALELVVQKESRRSGRRKTPGPLVLKKLGEIGDVRSAIGSLEFLCLRGDADGDWGAKVAFSKGKKASKETALTKMEEESLELITRREASLGIFHAVGKVVYNKREESSGTRPAWTGVEQLPDYLSVHSRPRRSQVAIDELIDETGTDTQTFIAALHENYILSCDAPPTSVDFSSLDHVNGCIEALSDSDLLCPDMDGSFNSTGFGGRIGGRGSGGDILRQDEISFQIAVRGILFSLPFPVKRKAPAAVGFRSGKGAEAFQMFYPTSLKLWRTKEENISMIDLWVTRLMKGGGAQTITAGAAAFARPKPGTVESWKTATASQSSSPRKPGKEADPPPLMAVGATARTEMLLERLPYMVHIARARKGASSTLAVRDMEKVTAFRGIGVSPDDTADEGEDTGVVGEEWATDKPVEEKSPRKKLVITGRGAASGLPLLQSQKLVLSDDDIEDD
jgi:cell cycle checkpoint protein